MQNYKDQHDYVINLGKAIREYRLYYDFNVEKNPQVLPCRVKMEWDGNVYDTGFLGSSEYNEELVNLGFSPVVDSNGEGYLLLNKNKQEPTTARVTVYTPIKESMAKIKLVCCDQDYGCSDSTSLNCDAADNSCFENWEKYECGCTLDQNNIITGAESGSSWRAFSVVYNGKNEYCGNDNNCSMEIVRGINSLNYPGSNMSEWVVGERVEITANIGSENLSVSAYICEKVQRRGMFATYDALVLRCSPIPTPAPTPTPTLAPTLPPQTPAPFNNTRYILAGSNFTPSNLKINSNSTINSDSLFGATSIQYNEQLQEEMDKLLTYPNAHCVYRSKKIVDGKKTNQDCLCVLVTDKIPKSQLNSNQIIPSTVLDSIPTDILQAPVAKVVSDCYKGDCSKDPRNKYRPLLGGISGALSATSSACTIGAIAKDSTDKTLVALTNNHCAGALYDPNYETVVGGSTNTNGLQVSQPSPLDNANTNQNTFGSVKRAIPFKYNPQSPIENQIDCALYSIDISSSPDIGVLNIAENAPVPFASTSLINSAAPIDNGDGTSSAYLIFKNGRTTCDTVGVILDTNGTVFVDFNNQNLKFNNSIVITWGFINGQPISPSDPRISHPFAAPGDSGSSAFLDTAYGDGSPGPRTLAGLVFASNALSPCDQPASQGFSYANRIDNIASALQIEPWQGDIVVSKNQNSTIVVNGRTYNRYEDTNDPITHVV